MFSGEGAWGKQQKAKCGPAPAWASGELGNLNSTTVWSQMEAREMIFLNILCNWTEIIIGCELPPLQHVCVCECVCKISWVSQFPFDQNQFWKGQLWLILASDNHNSWGTDAPDSTKDLGRSPTVSTASPYVPSLYYDLDHPHFLPLARLDCHFDTWFMDKLISFSVLPLKNSVSHWGYYMPVLCPPVY